MAKYPKSNPIGDAIEPFDSPPGDMFHTDVPFTPADEALGDKLAWYMGDLFIDSMKDAPVEQWRRVARALRIHGLKIVNQS